MRVLVTGGAGFIGANLVRSLVADPAISAVRVLDDMSTGSPKNLEGLEEVNLHVGSVTERDVVDRAMVGIDAVVHLAALPSVPRSLADPMASHHANATGTVQLLESVRRHGCPYVVIASSSSVYGSTPTLPKHEGLPVAPMSPYAVSKVAAEGYGLAYGASLQVPVLALRFFNVFGPLQASGHAYAAVIPTFVERALTGGALPIYGDGLQTRDFTYVGSVTAIIRSALHRRIVHGKAVNLAFGSRHTLLDVVEILEYLTGSPLTIDHLDPRPAEVRHSQADNRTLKELFGDTRPVGLREGLAATLQWFRSGYVPL